MQKDPKKFAAGTKVDVARTMHELRTLLVRYGADEFGSAMMGGAEAVMWTRNGITYRVAVPLVVSESEVPDSVRKAMIKQGIKADPVEHENNRRMRALLNVVKAQLIAIDDGITTFEETFVGAAVTDNGQTVAERMSPEIKRAALEGRVPRSLSLPGRQS